MATKKATRAKARRARGRTAVVRGPQVELFKPGTPAVDGIADKGRTPRMRYIERPNKKDGNPFFALRCPSELLAAMLKAATKKKQYRTEWAREVLAKAAGFKLDVEDEERAS